LEEYFVAAYKSGKTPKVTHDKIFLWSRLYPASSDVPQDAIGKPTSAQYVRQPPAAKPMLMAIQTDDTLWVIVFSTGGAVSVTLSCGSHSETSKISGSGYFKLKMSFNEAADGGQVSAVMKRNGAEVLKTSPPGFVFDRNPQMYNFNAFVAASDLGLASSAALSGIAHSRTLSWALCVGMVSRWMLF
jgi:glucan endo-1,3-alpha-glucosidase